MRRFVYVCKETPVSWAGFDGRGYSREQWLAHVAQTSLMPGAAGITEHATGIPTLAQALMMNPANYIKNTQSYYEMRLGWAHGPHLFADLGDGVSRPAIWGFSALDTRGTHCSCDNGRGFYGGEAMGNRNTEDYTSGPGKLVLDNQHFAFAALFIKMGKTPDPSNYLPHSHCANDGHFQCPHENWERDWRGSETAAIVDFMNAIGDRLPVNPNLAARAIPLYPPDTTPRYASGAWVQDALNNWLKATHSAQPPLFMDNDVGPATKFLVTLYQRAHGLAADGVPGALTCASLKLYLP